MVWLKLLFFVSGLRDVTVTETRQKEATLSVERVPGTLSIASKSVQVNGAATVSIGASCWASQICLSDGASWGAVRMLLVISPCCWVFFARS